MPRIFDNIDNHLLAALQETIEVSGSADPSESDKVFTETLFMALSPIGVTMLDHIIIGEDRIFSFADNGLLAEIELSSLA